MILSIDSWLPLTRSIRNKINATLRYSTYQESKDNRTLINIPIVVQALSASPFIFNETPLLESLGHVCQDKEQIEEGKKKVFSRNEDTLCPFSCPKILCMNNRSIDLKTIIDLMSTIDIKSIDTNGQSPKSKLPPGSFTQFVCAYIATLMQFSQNSRDSTRVSVTMTVFW